MSILYMNGLTTAPAIDAMPDGSDVAGRVKCFFQTYEFNGGEAENDVLRLFRVDAGTKILSGSGGLPSFVRTTVTAASTLTLDIGDDDASGDDDRYATNLNMASAGARAALDEVSDYVIVEDNTWITATFDTLATPVDGGKILFCIFYVEPTA